MRYVVAVLGLGRVGVGVGRWGTLGFDNHGLQRTRFLGNPVNNGRRR
jgi:hypothetical protein